MIEAQIVIFSVFQFFLSAKVKLQNSGEIECNLLHSRKSENSQREVPLDFFLMRISLAFHENFTEFTEIFES